METIAKNSYYFMVEKNEMPRIKQSGFRKIDEKTVADDSAVYLKTDKQNANVAPLILPKELEVVVLRHIESNKLTDKAQLIAVALQYQELGQPIPKYNMETLSLDRYIEILNARQAKTNTPPKEQTPKQEAASLINGEAPMQNNNLKALAIRLLNARNLGDRNTLVQMLESMKQNPELAQVFDESGKLSFQKLFDLAGVTKEEIEQNQDLHITKTREEKKQEEQERNDAFEFAKQTNNREFSEDLEMQRIEENIQQGEEVSDTQRDYYNQNLERGKDPFALDEKLKAEINAKSATIAKDILNRNKTNTRNIEQQEFGLDK